MLFVSTVYFLCSGLLFLELESVNHSFSPSICNAKLAHVLTSRHHLTAPYSQNQEDVFDPRSRLLAMDNAPPLHMYLSLLVRNITLVDGRYNANFLR